MSDRSDVIIIGAGVVGCAVAERLAGRGLEVLLLEALPREGMGLSSRNSGVVHSGLYYPQGSLKARACTEGRARLYAWCERQGVPFRRCGKLVLGVGSEGREALEDLARNGRACGAEDLRMIGRSEAIALEPRLSRSPADHALWCPHSGVVDAHGLTQSLKRVAVHRGVDVAFGALVGAVGLDGDGWRVETSRGEIRGTLLVNAAGLAADQVARQAGLSGYVHRYSRGDYFRWHGAPVFERLVYPVRPQGSAGLGVHVTLEIDGGVRLGPDAKWVSRDEPTSPPDALEGVFRARAAGLLGELEQGRLSWDGCGVRPKLFLEGGEAVDDFVVARHEGRSWHLLGIESPGLTAALALGSLVAQEVVAANP